MQRSSEISTAGGAGVGRRRPDAPGSGVPGPVASCPSPTPTGSPPAHQHPRADHKPRHRPQPGPCSRLRRPGHRGERPAPL